MLLLPYLLACNADGDRFWFRDSYAPLSLNLEVEDRLASPYLAGTRFVLSARTNVPSADLRNWRLDSSDEAVLEMERIDESPDAIELEAVARAEGEARLRLVDPSGAVAHEAVVQVLAADEARVVPLGFLAHPADGDGLDVVRVVDGGDASFQVHLYRDGVRLHGAGTVDVVSDVAAAVDPDASDEVDVVRITPVGARAGSMDIQVGGVVLGTVGVEVVPVDAVADLSIRDEAAGSPDEGTLTLSAVARTAAGDQVWGARPAWRVGGEAVDGTGDVLTYTRDEEHCVSAVAEWGAFAPTEPICGEPVAVGEATVSTTCGTVAGGAWLGLLGLPLALARRRRAR